MMLVWLSPVNCARAREPATMLSPATQSNLIGKRIRSGLIISSGSGEQNKPVGSFRHSAVVVGDTDFLARAGHRHTNIFPMGRVRVGRALQLVANSPARLPTNLHAGVSLYAGMNGECRRL